MQRNDVVSCYEVSLNVDGDTFIYRDISLETSKALNSKKGIY